MSEFGDGWRGAVEAVPRHLFVPARAWCAPEDRPGYAIDRAADPDQWMAAAYADAAIITQTDDGATDAATGEGASTSSLSAPGIVAAFLELLDPYDADEVLEIGTGTGWTAGLLAYRLGDGNVTSIEVDASVMASASDNLRSAGRSPLLAVGDGAEGWADRAPYDRVHVIVGVREVPHAWVEQTRPGGLIVFPWMPGWEGGHRAVLTVVGDGTAIGRFHGGCAFMMLRSQRPPVPVAMRDGRRSSTDLDPRRVVRASTGLDVVVSGMLPGVYGNHATDDDGSFDLWLWSGDSDAHVHYASDHKRFSVTQAGSQDLWDELHGAFLRWVSWGSPTRDRFGLCVAPEGQSIWLDSPDNPITP
ncbi:methyltransferase domain-containing protein [Actinomadura rudentiformis]|uniref:Protein-L-isoaspartate O-methyltransferase n=1 Tax=Actinomadura rudentiformis TaxID=359158 RepID=A0A6H9Z5T5_9ACTN|nr:protein-L-isoaspartate(D-aspartate) O-methyltransferase [Actinomadura rudentiformis]KAB2350200.1 protein-L-isoaspartate(D-aspartate) O-methyltransferase [Actinomadura rudentiformis]